MTLIPRRNKPCGREHPEDSRMLSLRSEIDRLFETFVREHLERFAHEVLASLRQALRRP